VKAALAQTDRHFLISEEIRYQGGENDGKVFESSSQAKCKHKRTLFGLPAIVYCKRRLPLNVCIIFHLLKKIFLLKIIIKYEPKN